MQYLVETSIVRIQWTVLRIALQLASLIGESDSQKYA